MKKYQKPIIKSGNIAVWPAKELDSGHKLYTISFEKANNERNYVTVLANIAGYELTPREILSLSFSHPVKIEDQNQYGPKICTIINRCILSVAADMGANTYFNHVLALGVAYHKIGKKGYTSGYICNGVNFHLHSLDPSNNQDIYLSPKDCFDLLEGKTITKNDRQAFLQNIAEIQSSENNYGDTSYMTAHLNIQRIPFDNPFHLRKHSDVLKLKDN